MDWLTSGLVNERFWLRGRRSGGASAPGFAIDTFTEGGTVALSSHAGELGAWTVESGVAHGAAVEATGRVRSNSSTAAIYSLRGPGIGADQWAEVTIRRGSNTTTTGGPSVAVRTGGTSAYFARYNPSGDAWELSKIVSGTITVLGTAANASYSFDATGATAKLRLTALGSALSISINGTSVITATDADLPSGYVGLRSVINLGSGTGPEFDDFTVGVAKSASPLLLTDPSRYTNYASINSVTDTTLDFTADAGAGQRYIVGFNKPLPVGSRLQFTVRCTGRVIVRGATDLTLSGGASTVYDGTPGGAGVSVDATIATDRPYFGFYAFTPGRQVIVTNFVATAAGQAGK